jgi:uncharacterized membrane protein
MTLSDRAFEAEPPAVLAAVLFPEVLVTGGSVTGRNSARCLVSPLLLEPTLPLVEVGFLHP